MPQSHVVCLPQKVNKLESADELGVLINSSAPEKWKPYCKHGYVAQLRGDEGTCPYTTFSVPGFPEEWRFLRHIKKVVADKIFPKLLEETVAKQPAPQNDRQKARIDVYRWTSKNDLPDKNQLSPEVNKWPEITASEEAPVVQHHAPDQKAEGSGDKKRGRTRRRSRSAGSVRAGQGRGRPKGSMPSRMMASCVVACRDGQRRRARRRRATTSRHLVRNSTYTHQALFRARLPQRCAFVPGASSCSHVGAFVCVCVCVCSPGLDS